MPSTSGFTATLTLDTSPSPVLEYGHSHEPSYASAYIVASEHTRFSITVAATEYVHPAVDIAVWIDGVYQDGRIMERLDKGCRRWEFEERFTGKEERGRRGMVKKLWRFGGVSVVEEMSGECESDSDVLHNLGTIEVVVLRCGNAKPGIKKEEKEEEEEEEEEEEKPPHPRAKKYWNNWEADQYPLRKKKAPAKEKPIWETHLKGKDLRHRVVTEKEFAVRRKSKEKTVEYLDSFENPYCILVMHYRSKAALQDLGLIPRSPSPSPSSSGEFSSPEVSPGPDEVERLESLSKEEILRELLEFKKSQAAKSQARAMKIKQEERDEEEMGRAWKRTKVKKEVVEMEEEEVVDLT